MLFTVRGLWADWTSPKFLLSEKTVLRGRSADLLSPEAHLGVRFHCTSPSDLAFLASCSSNGIFLKHLSCTNAATCSTARYRAHTKQRQKMLGICWSDFLLQLKTVDQIMSAAIKQQ